MKTFTVKVPAARYVGVDLPLWVHPDTNSDSLQHKCNALFGGRQGVVDAVRRGEYGTLSVKLHASSSNSSSNNSSIAGGGTVTDQQDVATIDIGVDIEGGGGGAGRGMGIEMDCVESAVFGTSGIEGSRKRVCALVVEMEVTENQDGTIAHVHGMDAIGRLTDVFEFKDMVNFGSVPPKRFRSSCGSGGGITSAQTIIKDTTDTTDRATAEAVECSMDALPAQFGYMITRARSQFSAEQEGPLYTTLPESRDDLIFDQAQQQTCDTSTTTTTTTTNTSVAPLTSPLSKTSPVTRVSARGKRKAASSSSATLPTSTQSLEREGEKETMGTTVTTAASALSTASGGRGREDVAAAARELQLLEQASVTSTEPTGTKLDLNNLYFPIGPVSCGEPAIEFGTVHARALAHELDAEVAAFKRATTSWTHQPKKKKKRKRVAKGEPLRRRRRSNKAAAINNENNAYEPGNNEATQDGGGGGGATNGKEEEHKYSKAFSHPVQWSMDEEGPVPLALPVTHPFFNDADRGTEKIMALETAVAGLFQRRPAWIKSSALATLRNELASARALAAEVEAEETSVPGDDAVEVEAERQRKLLEKALDTRGELARALGRFAYFCVKGPWKRVYLAFGFDPRLDPESRRFQILALRFTPDQLVVNGRGNAQDVTELYQMQTQEGEAGETEEARRIRENNRVFVCGLELTRMSAWQLCDVRDGSVRFQVKTLTDVERPSAKDGWFSGKDLNRMRVSFKERCLALIHHLKMRPPNANASGVSASGSSAPAWQLLAQPDCVRWDQQNWMDVSRANAVPNMSFRLSEPHLPVRVLVDDYSRKYGTVLETPANPRPRRQARGLALGRDKKPAGARGGGGTPFLIRTRTRIRPPTSAIAIAAANTSVVEDPAAVVTDVVTAATAVGGLSENKKSVAHEGKAIGHVDTVDGGGGNGDVNDDDVAGYEIFDDDDDDNDNEDEEEDDAFEYGEAAHDYDDVEYDEDDDEGGGDHEYAV